MSTKWSSKKVEPFVKDYDMDMKEYIVPQNGFQSFNDFFYRKVNPTHRPIGEGIVSPADGKLLAFQKIDDNQAFFVKGSKFTTKSFLQNDELAKKYEDGSMVIIRLAPVDYHRFHFPATGTASNSSIIKGHFYSVSPLALQQSLEIFCQNQREYTTLKTKQYGDILISEVGATMVGSIIHTYKANSEVQKGSEKGYFAFGGSTVVLLFEKGQIQFDTDLLDNTRKGLETVVKMGEKIAS